MKNETNIDYKLTERSKNKLFRMVFGRTFFVFSSVALQVLFIVLFTLLLKEYFIYFYAITTLISLMLCVHIGNNDINASYKVVWIFLILFVPIFGALFYLLIKIHPGLRTIKKKVMLHISETKPYLVQDDEVIEKLNKNNDELYGLSKYMNDYGGFPVYENSKVKYFKIGEEKFESLIEELNKATEFIFLEYYIVDEGIMWNTILDILKEKVKQGVEVRFMYDGMCSIKLLPHDYPKTMEAFGINCRVFSPIRPALSSYQNNRDHRKICVIDGRVAYTGGVNLADEYINKLVKFGHWKDNAVMITGEAVKSFTLMFLQNWRISSNTTEDYSKYIKCTPVKSKGYVMPYGDNPFDKENVGEIVYMDILNNAKDYVHIMSPYLVLDNEMILSLEYASKRGVDVKMILPHITDNPSAYSVARNLYPKLIERGIKIYEYTPGFVHAKTFVSDNKKAVVGTINMDFRSMYLNMECAAYFQEMDEVLKVEEDFINTLEKCEEITMEKCLKFNIFTRLKGKLLWIIAPLM